MKVRNELKKLRIHFFAVQQKSMRGDSDYCLCVAGRFVGLELKATGRSRVEKLQLYKLHAIERCGGVGIITFPDNWDTVYLFLQQLIVNPWEEKPECLNLPTTPSDLPNLMLE